MRALFFVPISLLVAAAPATAVTSFEQLPDPTRPHAQRAERASEPPSGLGYTRIGPAGRVAVIEGRQVREGDRFRGAEVIAIKPFEVVLREGGRHTVLRLTPALPKEASR